MTAVLVRCGRAFAALALVLGLATPGLDACLCGLFAAGPDVCCDESRAEQAVPGHAELDEGPCCCCALDVTEAQAPSPLTVTQRESKAADEGRFMPPVAMEPAFFQAQARSGAAGLRPPQGPDPSPPNGLIHRQVVVLLI